MFQGIFRPSAKNALSLSLKTELMSAHPLSQEQRL
jgi:hypothetical protein